MGIQQEVMCVRDNQGELTDPCATLSDTRGSQAVFERTVPPWLSNGWVTGKSVDSDINGLAKTAPLGEEWRLTRPHGLKSVDTRQS